jgi:hypothetical protein
MKKGLILWVMLSILFIFPSNAFAYLDPGTGSIILQGLAAALISAMVFWRTLRAKVKSWFVKPQGEKKDESKG